MGSQSDQIMIESLWVTFPATCGGVICLEKQICDQTD